MGPQNRSQTVVLNCKNRGDVSLYCTFCSKPVYITHIVYGHNISHLAYCDHMKFWAMYIHNLRLPLSLWGLPIPLYNEDQYINPMLMHWTTIVVAMLVLVGHYPCMVSKHQGEYCHCDHVVDVGLTIPGCCTIIVLGMQLFQPCCH